MSEGYVIPARVTEAACVYADQEVQTQELAGQPDPYATGVRDALRWLTTGQLSIPLIPFMQAAAAAVEGGR